MRPLGCRECVGLADGDKKMRLFLCVLSVCCLSSACVSTSLTKAPNAPALSRNAPAAQAAIMSVLQEQSQAWNRGDIEAFMDGYWKSEQLRFGSGGDITLGWQATIDRYKARYTDRAAMGQLEFSQLQTEIFSPSAAIVHGRWALQRENDRPSGLFTLVFRDFGEGWVIVSDTTTSAG